MIRSMTGYGRSEAEVDGKIISVEIKSVNHRFFEFSCRATRGYSFLEEKLKSYVNSRVSRGKIDMYVSIVTCDDGENTTVTVNHSLLRSYVEAFCEISEKYSLQNDATSTAVARFPDVLTIHKTAEDEEKILSLVLPVAEQAVNKFIEMRETEGERLKNDVMSRAETILGIVDMIEERSPVIVEEYEKRLNARIEELLGDNTYDRNRVLTEVAIFADKVAVSEETVRLRSHFEQMSAMLSGNDAVGRKLDFIVQEMNREANTIGSKVQDAELAHKVVDIKAEIEKIREQIQNIE